MGWSRNRVLVGVVATLAAGPLVLTTATPASAGEAHLRAAARLLRVAPETGAGYQRSKFRLWVDRDRDCQDTRAEVLRQESKVATRGSCTVTAGKWLSYYDRRTWTRASDVDVDHLVPLAEAWGSGAKRWTADTRTRYANDLGDRRTLVAVTDNVNQSKGSKDPAQWLPRYDQCRYVREWVAVKLRWRLTADAAEKRRVVARADHCRNTTLSWRTAKVTRTSSTGGGSGGGGTTTSGIRITKVVYDPAGDDYDAPNRETVTIRNGASGKRSLTGFRLRDETTSHVYRFPTFSLAAGASVVVHSGKGADTARHLYARWGIVWNNSGDTARLFSPTGAKVDSCSWTGSESGGTKYC